MRDLAPDSPLGASVTFTPSERRRASGWIPISGTLAAIVVNQAGELGANILTHEPGDPCRTLRAWCADGSITVEVA